MAGEQPNPSKEVYRNLQQAFHFGHIVCHCENGDHIAFFDPRFPCQAGHLALLHDAADQRAFWEVDIFLLLPRDG